MGLRLVTNHHDALGARVAIEPGARNSEPGTRNPEPGTLWRRARSDGSYASANDPRVVAGLGPAARVVSVRVIWPDGKTETWTTVAIDRYTTLREGDSR